MSSISVCLAPRSPGATVTWHPDHLAPRSPDATVTWHRDHLTPRSPGATVTWCHGHLVPRTTVTWHPDHLAPRSPGATVTWCHGHLAPRSLGVTVTCRPCPRRRLLYRHKQSCDPALTPTHVSRLCPAPLPLAFQGSIPGLLPCLGTSRHFDPK